METLPPAKTKRGLSAGSALTRFKPGHPGTVKGKKRNPEQASRLLGEMRRAFKNPRFVGRTPGQIAIKKLLDEHPKEFITQLIRLERDRTTAKAKRIKPTPESEPVVTPDVQTEATLELLDVLLTEAVEAATAKS